MAEDDNEDIPLNEQLAGLRSSITELVDPSTTPEAASIARGILADRPKRVSEREKAITEKLNEATKSARAALIRAREKLLEKPAYDPRLKWLRLAAAFGAPTKTGNFGETIGAVSNARADSLADELAAGQGLDKELIGLDTNLAGLDEKQLALQLAELQARRTDETGLDKEALKILSKRGSNAGIGSKPAGEFGKRAVDLLGDRAYDSNGHYTREYYATVKRLEAEDKKRRDATAGVDAPSVDDAIDTEAAANELGLPVLKIDPFRNASTKQRAARQTRLDQEAAKRLAELDEQTADAPETILKAKQFIEANKEVSTGGANRLARAAENVPWVGPTLKSGVQAVTSIGSDEAQLMDSISNELTPRMRPTGSGSSSNLDVQMFAGATLGRHNSFETNENIANAMIAQKQRLLEYKQYLRDYRQLYGHLEGADSAWKDYLEANPIFDPKLGTKNSVFQLNKDRKSYREWFKEQNQKNDPTLEGLTDEEIAAAKTPAMAEGGKVKLFWKVIDNKRQVKSVLSDEDKAWNLADRLQGIRGTPHMVVGTHDTDPEVVAWMAKLAPAKKAEGGVVEQPGMLESLGTGALQGATGELADEAGVVNRGRYRQALSDHPFATSIGQASGAAALIELGKQALLRTGLGPAALQMVPQAKLMEIGRLALSGSAVGAVWGAGAGQDDDRLSSGLQSAVLAGISAPLAGLAAKYGYTAAAGLGDRLRGRSASVPEKRILEALDADKVTPAQLTDRVRQARRNRVPMAIGEAGGRELTALSRAAAGYGRKEAQDLADETIARQGSARERVGDQVNRALAPSEYFASEDKLTKELYENSRPLYKAAYEKHPFVQSKALLKLLETPSGKLAAKAATRSIRDKPGSTIGKIDALGMIRRPSLEFADQVKQELDDMIRKEEAQGPTGAGRRMRALRNALRTELDTIAPEYQKAREQYAGDLEIRDALRSGRDEFSRLTPEEVRRNVKGMNYSELDAYRSGAAQRLFEMITNPSNEGNFAKKLIGSPAMTEKLEALSLSPAHAKVLKAALEREAELFESRKKLISKAESGAGSRAVESIKTPRLILEQALDIIRSQPVLREQTADAIAAKLKGTTEAELKTFESALSDKAARLATRRRRAGKAGLIGAIAAGALSAPGPKPKESLDGR